jgi:hypothetical protein
MYRSAAENGGNAIVSVNTWLDDALLPFPIATAVENV